MMCLANSGPLPLEPGEFYRALVDSSGDAIISKDCQGIITSWNKGAERIFGYTAAEMIGRPVTDLFPPGRTDEELRILKRIQAGERVDHYETVRRRKDGSLVDISLTVSPIFAKDGTVVGASKVARDITQQKREEERARVTLSSIGDAVMSTDVQGRVVFMNSEAERLTGWSQARAVGQPVEVVFRIVDEETRKTVESPIAEALRDRAVVGLKNHTVLISNEGSEHPVDDSAAPIFGPRGELIGGVLVFRDVAERREADIATVRLAAIVNGSDDAIIGKNLKGIVTSWNPGAERIFGYSAQEMIGQSILKLLPEERHAEEVQILERLQRGERVDHFQTERRHKDGGVVHVSLTISPIHDSTGEIVGASKIARDIGELKAAQAKLEASNLELEARVQDRTVKLRESIAELESFSYSLSHDMRAPLRAIQSYTELVLAKHGENLGDGAGYLRKVISSANRMDRLIRDVLNFSRIVGTEIEVGPLNVYELVSDIVRERPELQPPHASVTIEPSADLPIGHEASLFQCLANLLDNAVKFVSSGKHPVVRVFTEVHGDRVRICVADNGIGIDQEHQDLLFGLFQRLPAARAFGGTGVGLAIVRKAAERMNGMVGFKSVPGLGSTFWIDLPRA